MGRSLRYIPPGGALVEVTCRTIQSRFLLRPGPESNRRIRGVLGRALRRHPGIQLHFHVFLSNHYHLLLSTPTAQELAAFMGYLNGNLARELGRLHRWRERFWGRRYEAIIVSDEEAAQVGRLEYLLAQGSKEGLVSSPREWPGVTGVRALLDQSRERGTWYDRTARFEATRRGSNLPREDFAQEEIIHLEPLPCWSDLDRDSYSSRVRERVEALERHIHETHRHRGTRPVGKAAILRQAPHARPVSTGKSPAPRFHCATQAARRSFSMAYRDFVRAYREAVDRLRAGKAPVGFPEGAFLPSIPLQDPG